MSYYHQPVLVKEVLAQLNPQANQNFVDGTIGGGGHAKKILELTGPRGLLIGLDKDLLAVNAAAASLKEFGGRAIIILENYSNLPAVIKKIKIKNNEAGSDLQLSGILLDLGLSSAQVAAENGRGFSFQGRAALDMRYGPQSCLTAADILNNWSVEELTKIFKDYGQERHSRLIARLIAVERKKQPINFTDQLVAIIKQVYRTSHDRINPATRVFQALRIAVNDELDNLRLALPKLLSVLLPGGRLAVISFHSLEDRIVKNFFQNEAKDCLCPPTLPVCVCRHKKAVKILTKKPIVPSAEELKNNFRSRSAKLRAAQKL